jgi:hypothetical protein
LTWSWCPLKRASNCQGQNMVRWMNFESANSIPYAKV